MEWYVYIYDINSRTMRKHNVLAGREETIRRYKKESKSIEEFSKLLRSEMMAYYWSRCEWEILISNWCGGDRSEEKKIDVFDQLQLNWDVFVWYCWNNGDLMCYHWAP